MANHRQTGSIRGDTGCGLSVDMSWSAKRPARGWRDHQPRNASRSVDAGSIAEAEVRLRAWLESILNERRRQDVLTMQHHDLSDAEIEAWIDERLAPREADVDAMVVEFRRLAVVPSAPVH